MTGRSCSEVASFRGAQRPKLSYACARTVTKWERSRGQVVTPHQCGKGFYLPFARLGVYRTFARPSPSSKRQRDGTIENTLKTTWSGGSHCTAGARRLHPHPRVTLVA